MSSPPPVDYESIARGRHPDPYAVLGPELLPDGDGVLVRILSPGAFSVSVEWEGQSIPARWIHGDGVLEARLPGAKMPVRYQLRVEKARGEFEVVEDPYRFAPVLKPADLRKFALGEDTHAQERLGARERVHEGIRGMHFAVWAPNAARVSVFGDFNGWSARLHGMRAVGETGVWETFVPGVAAGALYKFDIRTKRNGRKSVKADPFGRAMELRPNTASIACADVPFPWTDADWMSERARRQAPDHPLSVYEVHLGSWRRAPTQAPAPSDGGETNWLDWDRLAETLIPHARDLGFTHLELLPVTEHPFDGSWGYQTVGYFAPTSRFGDADGMRRFVDRAHAAGLGILLDWVPAHFPRDAHGLAYFDGSHLFENEDPRRAEQPDWETYVFDWARPQVRSFLISSGLYWLEEFHVDGLRVDAVASMLYLDYSRGPGEWKPNEQGGRENWDAVKFLRALNEEVHRHCPGAITLAEESTSWPGVTREGKDGLGFDYKWNMGWMNDTLSFFRMESRQRAAAVQQLTFGLTYAFSERHLLPLSHDEVVHGKASLLSKMSGRDGERFANLRSLYGLMWAHPGRKLLFMGGEIGQWSEWNHDTELDWKLLDYPEHRGLSAWLTALNAAYRKVPALHEVDDAWDGFQWLEFTDPVHARISFLRRSRSGSSVLVVANLSDSVWKKATLGVPLAGTWRALVHSDDEAYAGRGEGTRSARTRPGTRHEQPHSVDLEVPPLSISYWTPASKRRAPRRTQSKQSRPPQRSAGDQDA
ncbi:MAG: 1,4-alpha-glucan branching enzyme GlgB [Gemmatimonadota bacterium]|nr:MAG: 1,4-alpha-glucan branching enzyme GlgB [Gemmatimonadota bacterium]